MIGNQRIIAVIPGRGGSKGLPGKNHRPVAGRPMIQHAICDALESAFIDRILVSTDCERIGEAARAAGVEVIMRPPELATDTATVDSAVRHAIEAARDDAPLITILYANVPVRPDDLIDRAIRELLETGADSVQSYCAVGKHHPHWMVEIDEAASVSPHMESRIYRRQDLPALYIPDGGVIVVRRESLFTVDPDQPHAFLGRDRRAVITQPGDVVDVDRERDLRLAEVILSDRDHATTARPARRCDHGV